MLSGKKLIYVFVYNGIMSQWREHVRWQWKNAIRFDKHSPKSSNFICELILEIFIFRSNPLMNL